MTKGIRSYPEEKRKQVVDRRLKSSDKGAGYWAARDYQDRKEFARIKAKEAAGEKLTDADIASAVKTYKPNKKGVKHG